MTTYHVDIPRQVYKIVKRLPGNVRQRVRAYINSLAENPRPNSAKPLRDHQDVWRYRIDDWRIVWRIYDDSLVVVVVKVGRKAGPEFYEDLFEDD